jgi:hypothetical protein
MHRLKKENREVLATFPDLKDFGKSTSKVRQDAFLIMLQLASS